MSNMSDQTKQEPMSHVGLDNGASPGVLQMIPNTDGNVLPGNGTGATTTTSRSKPQACKVCGKMLSSASSYYVHMKLHSGTKPYRCGVSQVVAQFIERTSGTQSLTVAALLQVCEAAFCRKPYLEVHMRTHTGERPFQCNLCLKRFSQKSSLNTHKRIHTGNSHSTCLANLIRHSSVGFWPWHSFYVCASYIPITMSIDHHLYNCNQMNRLLLSINLKRDQCHPFRVSIHSRGATVPMSLWKVFYSEMCPDFTRPNSYRFVHPF